MSYFITIAIAVVFWALFIYSKNGRLYLGEPIKFPYVFYLVGFIILLIPIMNIIYPLALHLWLILDSDFTVKPVKSRKETIGRKIIRFLTEKYY